MTKVMWINRSKNRTPMKCTRCGSEQIYKNGHRRGRQNHRCKNCGRQFIETRAQRGYSDDVKQICLRMYRYGKRLREIEQLVGVSHSTIHNWVKQAEFLPNNLEDKAIQENTDSG